MTVIESRLIKQIALMEHCCEVWEKSALTPLKSAEIELTKMWVKMLIEIKSQGSEQVTLAKTEILNWLLVEENHINTIS